MNYTIDINTLINDLRRIENNASCVWISSLDDEDLEVVRIGVETYNQYAIDNGWLDCVCDWEEFASDKTWCIENLIEALESM